MMIGADAPIPPVMIGAAAPKGTPRRFHSVKSGRSVIHLSIRQSGLPCLGVALRREALVIIRYTNRCLK